MYALVNCDIYTGESVEYDKAIVVDGSNIKGVIGQEDLAGDTEIIDLGGACVAPGFIDIQVNGGGGVLLNDSPTVEGVKAIVEAHRKYGTTNLLPTFITGPRDGMARAANAINSYMKDEGLKGVLGIHYEGPFLEKSKAGVHDKRFIRPVNNEDLQVISSIEGGVSLVTLAPEVVSAEIIGQLSSHGIRVSLGHTNADCDQVNKALESGATCVTHLYNAMSPLTSRAPGVVGAALDDRNSWMGIIVDGFHADFVSVRVAIRAKGSRRTLLVTDAMPPVGSEDAHFQLGDYEITVDGGRCVTADGTLAGSALDMATAVRNCVQRLGIPLDEALRMASTYPAEFLGLDDQLGRVSAGYRANLAIFNNQLVVSAVVVEGEFTSFV